MCWTLWAAFFYAPRAKGFEGEISRILFFHVPLAWSSFLAFLVASFASARYLQLRRPAHDRLAAAAVELGLLTGVLATLTGAVWARVTWGAYWSWDPRQTSILLALLFFGAYGALRAAIEDVESRRRLAAVYGSLGFVVAPFFFFILPRLGFSLHPEPIVNFTGKLEMDRRMLAVLLVASGLFTLLFGWILSLRCRILKLTEEREEVS
jgi:heme exporter protein C